MTEYEWMTTAEVAEAIRKSPDYVARQCKLKNLKGTKLGNDWRIHRTSVDAFMAQGTSAPPTRVRRRAS